MKCLFCDAKMSAGRTQQQADGTVRRRRDCAECGVHIQTREMPQSVDLSDMEAEARATARQTIDNGELPMRVRISRR